jgi:DNA-binding CsgD family transcriptional regulator
VAVLQGDFAAVGPYLEESWAVASRIRDSWSLPRLLETGARLAAAREDWGRALRLLASATALRELRAGRVSSIRDQDIYEPGPDVLIEQARNRIGVAAADAAWEDGRAMTIEEAFACALEGAGHATGDSKLALEQRSDVSNSGQLTPRELEVLRLIAQGKTNRAIAVELVLSEHTVARHVANILGKLDLPSRAAAAAFASRTGIA